MDIEELRDFPKITHIAARVNKDFSIIFKLPIGYNHNQLQYEYKDNGYSIKDVDLGFLSEDGEWLSRDSAKHHANIHNQVLEGYENDQCLYSYMLKF